MTSVSELLDTIENALRGVFPNEDEMDAAFDLACDAFDDLRKNLEAAPTTTFEAGYVREAGDAYNPTAVRWWIAAIDDDGFLYARGGREPTEQAAASELAAARSGLQLERAAWTLRKTHELMERSLVRRFSHELMPDGTLRPLVPTDWEVDE